MILLLLSLPILLAILGCIYWYGTIPRNIPPGPLGLPLIGSAFSTLQSHGLYKKLSDWTQRYGPLYSMYVADRLVVVLGSYEMIQEALVKQGETFASRPIFNAAMPHNHKEGKENENDPDLWRTHRRFGLSTLRDLGVGRPVLEHAIQEESGFLVAEIESHKGRPFDPTDMLCFASANMISRLTVGRRFDYDDERFEKAVANVKGTIGRSGISHVTPFKLSEKVARLFSMLPSMKMLKQANNEIAAFSKSEVPLALEGFDPKHDEPMNYVQAFHKARQETGDEAKFADGKLFASMWNMFVAGTETTSTAVRWVIFYLAHFPELQEQVFAEIRANISGDLTYADRKKLPLVEATILETLRMGNIVAMGPLRRAVADTKLCGYDIPENTAILPLLTTVMRDPKVYPNPDKFDPRRFLEAKKKNGDKDPVFTHVIPFMAGKRICLGEPMARMELFMFFTALVSNFELKFPIDVPKPPLDGEVVTLVRGPPVYKICAIKRSD